MTEWYEIPICVGRNGELYIIAANEVQPGDKVWMGLCQYTVHDILPDDDEEVMYIKINDVDAWPAAMFYGTKG